MDDGREAEVREALLEELRRVNDLTAEEAGCALKEAAAELEAAGRLAHSEQPTSSS